MQQSQPKKKVRRSRVLVDKPLQLKLTAWFAAMTMAAILMQYIFLVNAFAGMGYGPEASGPGPGLGELFDAATRAAFLSALVVVPLTITIGAVATFRIAGPVYGMKRFLTAVVRGEKPEDYVLRKGDELGDLCHLVNEATRPVREGQAESVGDEWRASA